MDKKDRNSRLDRIKLARRVLDALYALGKVWVTYFLQKVFLVNSNK
ncbi:hypothetical protein [Vibrio alginolyticus]|nr:hypothetical protein [Vibrio alginolyticus]